MIVVAGDNLQIPLLGQFLQNAGAFFIRRAWGGDALYATVVQAYIDILLSKGYNFQCFIEGTRSRTGIQSFTLLTAGKLLVPKVGMLRLLCNTILREKASDCWILPVSVQYDRVIETDTYVDELLGKPKVKESLAQLITRGGGKLGLKMGIARVTSKLTAGRIDVHFGTPWSLKQFLAEQHTIREYDRMLFSLGYRILNDINVVTVIMPGALVGTVILTLRGRGVGHGELIRRVEWLRDRILAKGGRVAEFGSRTTAEIVDRALEVLKGLIGEVKGLAEPTFFARDRFQLSFYRNQVMHLFVSEVIISVALYTRIKQGGAHSNQSISYRELSNQCEFLSQLLKTEFVFELARTMTDNINKALTGLERDRVIVWNKEQDIIELSPEERARGRENYDFYCFLALLAVVWLM
jgi:glycerol-3-phosphate O-acyltransferase